MRTVKQILLGIEAVLWPDKKVPELGKRIYKDIHVISARVTKLRKVVRKMPDPVTRAQMQADLSIVTTSLTDLCTAVDTLLASKAPEDFTAEDTALKDAAAKAQAELAKINPTPAPGP
jgi:hypothetical protein